MSSGWAKTAFFNAVAVAGAVALSCAISCAEERSAGGDRFAGLLSEKETADMQRGLESWTDDAILAAFRGRSLTEEDLKGIYREFSDAVALMPHGGQWAGNGAAAYAAAAAKAEALGRKAHNMLLAMNDDDFNMYGKFVGLVREVLFFDNFRMTDPPAADTEAVRRWKEMHAVGVKEIEREYLRIAITAWGVETAELDEEGENGAGTANLPDGSVYEGNFENGLFNGYGTRTWRDGHKYDGEYKDGLPDGKGVETWSDGMRYEGEFREGRWYGKGTVIWKDGRRYEVENY